MIAQLHFALVGFFDKEGYPLARHFWLARSGLAYPAVIISVYLLFATVFGPLWMRNRQPYTSLRPWIIFYNFLMSFANLYFFFRYIALVNFGAELGNFKVPDPVAEKSSPEAIARISTLYLYLITKYLDLLDTVFFVLRKKNSHISFLHLYHHSSVAFLGTLLFLMYPSCTPIGVFILLNSAIHVVMYFYYGLSALGPGMAKYLWWKKYITQAQIVQFVIYLVYYTVFAVRQEGYHSYLIYNFACTQSPLYLFLFIRFYLNTYKKSSSHKLEATRGHEVTKKQLNDFEGERDIASSDGHRKRSSISKYTYATLSQS